MTMTIRLSARVAILIVTAGAVSTALSACGYDQGGAPDVAPRAENAAEAPSFEGPYAAEYAEFYRNATSDFARSALEDGAVSDKEYAEMTSQFASCLEDNGIEFRGFNQDGSFSSSVAPHGGDTDAIVQECSRSVGEDSVGALYTLAKINPENQDVNTLMANCLVGTGAVPLDYSAMDFSVDNTGRFGDLDSLSSELRAAILDCNADPLGLLDQEAAPDSSVTQ